MANVIKYHLSHDGNPIDEIVQESLEENDDFTQIKQVITEYYTM